MSKVKKEKNEKGESQGHGFFPNLIGTFNVMILKIELQQTMNGCREIAEIFSREARESGIELNKDIIEKAYKLRLQCYSLTEKLAYNADMIGEKYNEKEVGEEVIAILEDRKKFWEFCEKEMEKNAKEIEENRIADKVAEKIIRMAKDGKESSKRLDAMDLKNGIPYCR